MFQNFTFVKSGRFLESVVERLTILESSEATNGNQVTIQCQQVADHLFEDRGGRLFKQDSDGDLLFPFCLNEESEFTLVGGGKTYRFPLKRWHDLRHQFDLLFCTDEPYGIVLDARDDFGFTTVEWAWKGQSGTLTW